MRYVLLFFFVLFPGLVITAQETVEGTVIDKRTKEPLAFANLACNGDNHLVVMTDVDGHFSIPWKNIHTIKCSFIGYETLVVSAIGPKVLLQLERQPNMLAEVAVNSGDTRAKQIMRRVIANKPLNDPEHLNSFSYKSYNKVTFDFLYNKNRRDSIMINKKSEIVGY